jgi:striatin 1/3/4
MSVFIVKAIKAESSRTKTFSTAGKSTVAPSRLSTLQDEDKIMRDEKEGSGSEHGSDEGCELSVMYVDIA